MNYWSKQYTNNSTTKQLKYRVILKAGYLFELTYHQTEELANKAGLSLSYLIDGLTISESELSKELFFYDDIDDRISHHGHKDKVAFTTQLDDIITLSGRKLTDLCKDALISERMVHHMRKGQHLRKEAIIALFIVLEQELENIQVLLKKAGYILSDALPNDVVIMWLLRHEVCFLNGANRLLKINDVLEEMDFPLLMTRPKL